ncbi:TetR/AcrR family transcriptional regulator [Nocardioides sp. zg-DK7169]|uniref:TetR/AcrR family transcriptional regulator n=1 Tax=Nocardioides sp. zg-DK7169 TaxID=2736600 RepID=UPI001554F8A6|nr:TetR/AcrR family transcriptional regulator [Nocardioides sp. zg-DK7169]NPC95883.1 helix-turn-helix transcriptional regulator [Nocardioides sp. zg-DK7169]
MRADAARRRAAIVEAGRNLFAERGSEVALDTVAEAAGVGIATLYRNFDSRGALLDEVALAILADLEAAAEEAVTGLDTAPGPAWETCLRRLVDLDLGALTAALAEHVADALAPPVREAQDRTLARLDELLAAVREHRLVRPDLTALELVIAVGTITRPQPASVLLVAPDLQARLVSILLAGLRPQDPPPR